MSGAIKFIKMAILIGLLLQATGSLLKVTGILGKAAFETHQNGGIQFREINRLIGHGN